MSVVHSRALLIHALARALIMYRVDDLINVRLGIILKFMGRFCREIKIIISLQNKYGYFPRK